MSEFTGFTIGLMWYEVLSMHSNSPLFSLQVPNLATNAMSVLSTGVPRKNAAYFFHPHDGFDHGDLFDYEFP